MTPACLRYSGSTIRVLYTPRPRTGNDLLNWRGIEKYIRVMFEETIIARGN